MVVNSAEDYESQLICTANAEPKPKIYWVKDNKIIKSDDRVKVMEINDSLILQIRKTQGSDFGDYTCLAQNRLGKAEQTASLTDRPAFVKFQQTESSPDGRSITLVWLVESVAPIVKYELMVKSRKSKKWWITNPQVRNPRNSDSFYEVRAELTNLEFGEYEVKLMSENVNGWTEFSQVHSFRRKFYHHTFLCMPGRHFFAHPHTNFFIIFLFPIRSPRATIKFKIYSRATTSSFFHKNITVMA